MTVISSFWKGHSDGCLGMNIGIGLVVVVSMGDGVGV